MTFVDPDTRVYSRQNVPDVHPLDETKSGTPTLHSSASDVRQALQSGKAAKTTQVVVDGRQAIALTMSVSLGAHDATEKYVLFADARTFQPLRVVTSATMFPDVSVSNWMPSTAANIAQAKDEAVPAGYTRVNRAW